LQQRLDDAGVDPAGLLVVGIEPVRRLNFWTRTHDVHHYYCRNNYSSIFPFRDQVFGTHEAGVTLPAKLRVVTPSKAT
jgi:sterol desaturase/sphingolipid hydroxylase (fatty acid hydroxylase superfamily)